MADLLRWLVIGEATFLAGFAAAIMVEARKFRAPPRHVWWIATSYIVLVAGYAIEVHGTMDNPIGYRTILALLAFTFGIVAMFEMWRAYRHSARIARHSHLSREAALTLLGDVDRKEH